MALDKSPSCYFIVLILQMKGSNIYPATSQGCCKDKSDFLKYKYGL